MKVFLDIHSASLAINLPGAWLDLIITGRVVVAREFIVGGMNGNGPMSFYKNCYALDLGVKVIS